MVPCPYGRPPQRIGAEEVLRQVSAKAQLVGVYIASCHAGSCALTPSDESMEIFAAKSHGAPCSISRAFEVPGGNAPRRATPAPDAEILWAAFRFGFRAWPQAKHLGDACERRGLASIAPQAPQVPGCLGFDQSARDHAAETLVRSEREHATGEFGHCDPASKRARRAHPHLVVLVGERPGQLVGTHPWQAGDCEHGHHAHGLLRRPGGCVRMTGAWDARRGDLHHGRAGCQMAGISKTVRPVVSDVSGAAISTSIGCRVFPAGRRRRTRVASAAPRFCARHRRADRFTQKCGSRFSPPSAADG